MSGIGEAPRAQAKKMNRSRDANGLTARGPNSLQNVPCPLPSLGHTVTGDQSMGQASVIFADDNVMLRKFLRMIIQDDPNLYVAKEAGNGLELLEQLKETTPDIIVLDISMPGLSGLEAAKKIKALYPKIKIVILTMNNGKSYFRRACEIGVDGYVLKDEIENIHHIITAVLQGRTYISSYFQ
jgi:DNA-binding NarL/FixJ family response regulator